MNDELKEALKRYEIDEDDDQYHVHSPCYVNIYKKDLQIFETEITATFRIPHATITLFKKVKMLHVTIMPAE